MLWEGAVFPHTATACADTFIVSTWKEKQVTMIVGDMKYKIKNNWKKKGGGGGAI